MTIAETNHSAAGQVTYAGCRVPPLGRGLPKSVVSLCPECRRRIPAELRDVAGQVRMFKTCPEHGPFEDIYWSDAQLYRQVDVVQGGVAGVIAAQAAGVGAVGLLGRDLRVLEPPPVAEEVSLRLKI